MSQLLIRTVAPYRDLVGVILPIGDVFAVVLSCGHFTVAEDCHSACPCGSCLDQPRPPYLLDERAGAAVAECARDHLQHCSSHPPTHPILEL